MSFAFASVPGYLELKVEKYSAIFMGVSRRLMRKDSETGTLFWLLELAGEPGFEPGLNDPESFVLPLHYSPASFLCYPRGTSVSSAPET